MKILVTGGTGVIGAGLIPELLSRGHAVRLLSRHADEDAARWNGVEAVAGDVSTPASLRGAVATCDAVIHIAGIAVEHPPEVTFQSVNVDGTRHLIEEIREHSDLRRFVFISSLGADAGSSDYHRSKREAEGIVRESGLDWTIVRPGSVYGPGDEVISNVLKMARVLPAVPVIDSGNQEFQPIWFEDLGAALARIVERHDLAGEALDIAGPDLTSLNDLLEKFAEITGRKPLRVPVPMPLASLAAKLASMAVEIPLDETKLTMLREKNVLPDSAGRPLESLGIQPTPLDDGLRKLADLLPEQQPEDGVGPMHHKRVWADIAGSPHSAVALMSIFRDRVTDLMPIEFAAEPGAPTRIEKGVTMTGSLPLRGNFQVRVEVVEPMRVVLATLEGHPLAGIVEFTTEETAGGVRFAIDVFTRASNLFDLIALSAGGEVAQSANWRTVVQNVIDASGGTSDGVHRETRTLDEEEAEAAEARIQSIVQKRQRDESASGERPAER
ncbi:MAG TPA: NAD(P)H-binding protein [Thermoanaerobaculia bacterium]|nr:NAD(P)H-binding protein [Thermoanaerobaculia bacterium]